MAIKINTTLSKSGIPIPTGALVKPVTQFPADIIKHNKDGSFKSKQRRIIMFLEVFASTTEFLLHPDKNLGEIDDFHQRFPKIMSDAEFNSLMNNGLLAEMWLKDWLEDQIGVGTCEIIDPYPPE